MTAPPAPLPADAATRPGNTAATAAPAPAVPPASPPPDPWAALRAHTPARIALGRAGTSLPTHELLRFAAAHAQARDAVHVPLDGPALATALQAAGWPTLAVASRAPTRAVYLRRPDWGRRLDEPSVAALRAAAEPPGPAPDLAIIVGDGLSATAVQRHAPALLAALRPLLPPGLRLAPLVLATQARVALADEVGALLGARLALFLIGERPGLSSPDSVGAYLTHAPRLGRSDAERNCISNVRPAGLPPERAAQRLAWLIGEALRRQTTGIALKDDSASALLGP